MQEQKQGFYSGRQTIQTGSGVFVVPAHSPAQVNQPDHLRAMRWFRGQRSHDQPAAMVRLKGVP